MPISDVSIKKSSKPVFTMTKPEAPKPRGKTQAGHGGVTPVLREMGEPGLFGIFDGGAMLRNCIRDYGGADASAKRCGCLRNKTEDPLHYWRRGPTVPDAFVLPRNRALPTFLKPQSICEASSFTERYRPFSTPLQRP